MFSHVFMKSVDVLEETNVAELVQLVMSDGLYCHVFAEIIQVSLGWLQLPQYLEPGKLTFEVEVNL